MERPPRNPHRATIMNAPPAPQVGQLTAPGSRNPHDILIYSSPLMLSSSQTLFCFIDMCYGILIIEFFVSSLLNLKIWKQRYVVWSCKKITWHCSLHWARPVAVAWWSAWFVPHGSFSPSPCWFGAVLPTLLTWCADSAAFISNSIKSTIPLGRLLSIYGCLRDEYF